MPEALKDGVLTAKVKELIALGIAVCATCDYCIAIHVKKCFEAGASKDEIAEALGISNISPAAALRSTYSTFAMQAIEDLAPRV